MAEDYYEKGKINTDSKITAPAMVMVPISESMLDRILFNDVVERILGHDVNTQEEMDKIVKIFTAVHSVIEKDDELANYMLPGDITADNREEFRKFHNKVMDTLEEC